MKNKALLKFKSAVAIMLIAVVMSFPSLLFAGDGSDLRLLTSFNKIDVGGPYKVVLVQGDREQVLVEANEELLSRIITKVENGTLKIYNEEKIKSSGTITLTITFKKLTGLDCSGAISLTASGPLQLSGLELGLSGASKVVLNINADKLDVDISGSGNATLTGRAQKVDLDISGTGSFSAAEMEVSDYEIEISGAGNAAVHALKKLDVEISGAGAVRYKGTPVIKENISGAGSIGKM